MKTIEGEIREIRNALNSERAELARKRAEAIELHTSTSSIKALIARLQKPENEADFSLRAQVAARLASIVDRVLVFPAGDAPASNGLLKFAIEALEGDPSLPSDIADIAEEIRSQVTRTLHLKRFFLVLLKNGHVTLVTPQQTDPFKVEGRPLIEPSASAKPHRGRQSFPRGPIPLAAGARGRDGQ